MRFVPPVRRLLVLVVAALLLAAACSPDDPVAQPTTDDEVAGEFADLGPTDDERNTIAIASRFGPSAVSLLVTVEGQTMLPFDLDEVDLPADVLPRFESPPQQSSGSGFLIAEDGRRYVVTNFHVVQEALEPDTSELLDSASISGVFGESGRRRSLTVVGVNPSFDLALLEAAEGDELPNVRPIPLADSDLVQKGQKAIAIGNPFGLGATLTTGTVSSTGRFVESVGQVSVPMIQTDAATNPGNSGGALLNSSGELIGINTAIFNPEARAFAGIGFAVPSNLLREALANLELGGVSQISDTRPTLGAQLMALSMIPQPVRDEANLPEEGAIVLSVVPGGAAEQAGLRAPEFTEVLGLPVPIDPDVIIAIDGRPVNDAADVNVAITYNTEPDEAVVLTVVRGDATEEITVTFE